ncbi:lytic transglycosylase domain-containing protein [Roseateles albus]|uniref:Lytic transglycosylase domain-containing protein n=1 Tax=Roseateles albus TaxID=2987525 RepID=A0ABT5KBS4_9BURK|nr:lytic transglycosylase domain-containing protein [Roseateles albus]MDC8771378.1 lytic transglycosylase domain-containing protein [Roseateles albus]
MRFGLVFFLAALAWPAQAELWAYVDGAGTAHLADRQLSGAYNLVLGAPDPSKGRVPGKQDGSRHLLTWLEIAPEVKAVQPYLREAAAKSGVDMALLKAVIAVESGYKSAAVSPRGAIGLMQITPDAAARYATLLERLQPAEKRLLDPRTNVLTGARMLADLIKRFGRIDAALAAWNAGEGAVRRAGGVVPPIDETQAHVHLVLELYWTLLQNGMHATAQHLTIHSDKP